MVRQNRQEHIPGYALAKIMISSTMTQACMQNTHVGYPQQHAGMYMHRCGVLMDLR